MISGENPYYRINSVCLQFTPTPPVVPAPAAEIKETTEEKKKSELLEFPLPAPAIALIEDEPAPGWSIMSLAVGTVAGVIIGASGFGWYSNRATPTDSATTTPETVATTTEQDTTPDETDDTEPERPAVIRETTPEPEESPILPADTGTTSQ